jgi:hypothetical protein
MNYGHVPVDLGPHAFVSVSVNDVDAAAWNRSEQRVVFVYFDPIEQALAAFNDNQTRLRSAQSQFGERLPADRRFHEYLVQQALPSYAKLFVSYQAMAEAVPGAVLIVAEDPLRAEPSRMLPAVLSHLKLGHWQSALIDAVATLSRREHIVAIEKEFGLRLISSRVSRRTVARPMPETVVRAARDPGLRRDAMTLLASMGVNSTYFQALPAQAPLRANAAAFGGA